MSTQKYHSLPYGKEIRLGDLLIPYRSGMNPAGTGKIIQGYILELVVSLRVRVRLSGSYHVERTVYDCVGVCYWPTLYTASLRWHRLSRARIVPFQRASRRIHPQCDLVVPCRLPRRPPCPARPEHEQAPCCVLRASTAIFFSHCCRRITP